MNGFFNYMPSAHSDAYVERFAAEMRRLGQEAAAAGRRAIFFLASDQRRARLQLRARVGGSHTILELRTMPDEEVKQRATEWASSAAEEGVAGEGVALEGAAAMEAGTDEGRERRDRRAVQRAVAEWMLLAGAEVIVRTCESSFSAEAALMNGASTVDIEAETPSAEPPNAAGAEETDADPVDSSEGGWCEPPVPPLAEEESTSVR